MPVAPRAESAGIGGMFAADLPVALATVAQAPAQRPASAGERPDPDGAVPDPAAGEVLRGIALGILMERFRLTREAAGQRLAAIAARSGRGEDEIAEQCVRAIDALNAAGVSDPAG